VLAVATLAQAAPSTIGACTVLPADNIWNTPVDQLPLAKFGELNRYHPGGHDAPCRLRRWFVQRRADWHFVFITVPRTQTKYQATFLYADESDPGPYAVPLNAPIECGSQSTGDRHANRQGGSVNWNEPFLYSRRSLLRHFQAPLIFHSQTLAVMYQQNRQAIESWKARALRRQLLVTL